MLPFGPSSPNTFPRLQKGSLPTAGWKQSACTIIEILHFGLLDARGPASEIGWIPPHHMPQPKLLVVDHFETGDI
jgi:hypothetical protein